MEGTDRRRVLLADGGLLLVALFWGSNFVIMKEALEEITPLTYLGLRFALAFLLLLLFFWRRFKGVTLNDILVGSLVGLFLSTGFIIQTLGLLHTTPAKSGFITSTSVIMVPFLHYLLTRVSPGWWSFFGCALATLGLYSLSAEGPLALGYGDLLTLVAASLFAIHIVAFGIFSPKKDFITLATIQLGFSGILCLILAALLETGPMLSYSPSIWGAILYAVLFCTIGAFVTQTAAQRYTPATHTALILSLEAVFAGLFSYFFWNELFTLQKILGAALILFGILTTELGPYLFKGRWNIKEKMV